VGGVAPHTSVVNWKLVGATELGDVYDFSRRVNSIENAASQVEVKQITYHGIAVVVFDDGFQQVLMTPRPMP
jgi:hypothetical protein